jgi:thymidylate synthase
MKEYDRIDPCYQDMLSHVLTHGTRSSNRTDVDTKSVFGYGCKVDMSSAFPILTLKDMSGSVFESMVAEMIWYLTGESHIDNLKEHTSIWNQWADDENRLDFAYGRFWRRYPVADLKDQLDGESWVTGNKQAMDNFVKEEVRDTSKGQRHVLVFDQIKYILHTLRHHRMSRRMVLNAWHPANASVSNPPACHVMATFNVKNDSLNCHLNMRSSDIGLGWPFNIAQYSMLTHLLCDQVKGLSPGSIFYSGTDVHLYTSDDDDNPYDQINYAQKMIDREPNISSPTLSIASRESIDAYRISDITLTSYKAHSYEGMKAVP